MFLALFSEWKRAGKTLCSALALALVLSPVRADAGGSYNVTNANDSGAGSLRQAVSDLNTSTVTSNSLYFTLGSDITITLGSPLDKIAKPVTITNDSGVKVTVYSTLANTPILSADASTVSFGGANPLILYANTASLAYGLSNDTTAHTSLNLTTISSNVSITAQAATNGAYAVFSDRDLSLSGTLAGTLSATAGTHTAIGLFSGGTLNGGSATTPLTITGTIAATANGLAVAVASAGAMNLSVSGILSGVDASGGGAGYAIRAGSPDGAGGWTTGSANNTVTLNTGATLTGKVDLGTGVNTLNLYGIGSTSSQFIGVTNLVVGNGSSTNWSLTPSATSTFGNVTINSSAALTVNENVAVTGNILDNGSLTFDLGADSTYGGVISGSGSVIKTGGGTLFLRGANTYTGGTYFNGGIINVVSDANLGDPSGPLVFNGGTLQTSASITSARFVTLNAAGGTFDSNGYDSTLSGTISGVGALTKVGAGTLFLTGFNTYSGGTNLNGGVVNVQSDANLGDASGPLTFNGGALQTSGALTSARAVTVASGGGALDNAGNAVTWSGTWSGGGPFSLLGSGTTTLAGNGSTYTGSAALLSGQLTMAATGSLGGTLTVSPGATLSGYGILNTVVNNGLVSPGGSIGTLTLTGDYTQGATAYYLDEIDPSGQGDRLNVAGRATLNGGVLVVSAPIAFYPTWAAWPTIVASGGQSGGFSGVIQPFRSYTLLFVPFSGPGGTVTLASRLPYTLYAASPQAAAAGNGLNMAALSAGGNMAMALLSLDLASPASIASALDRLHPEPYDAFTQSGFDAGRMLTASVRSRLRTLRSGGDQAAPASPLDAGATQAQALNGLQPGQGAPASATLGGDGTGAPGPYGVFLQPFGMIGRQDSNGGRTAYGFSAWGAQGGLDVNLSPGFAAGISAGYLGRRLDLRSLAAGSGQADTVSLGAYASRFGPDWFLEGTIRAGRDAYRANRTVWSPCGSLPAKAAWAGWNATASVGGGVDYRWKAWTLGPLASADYALIAQDGYTESGAGVLGLKVRPRLDSSLRTALGGRLARTFATSWGEVVPEVSLLWRHEFFNAGRDIRASFAGSDGSLFTTRTVPTASDWASLAAGVTVRWSRTMSLDARVDADLFRPGYQAQSASLSLRYSF